MNDTVTECGGVESTGLTVSFTARFVKENTSSVSAYPVRSRPGNVTTRRYSSPRRSGQMFRIPDSWGAFGIRQESPRGAQRKSHAGGMSPFLRRISIFIRSISASVGSKQW